MITKESGSVDGSFEEFYTLTALGRIIAHRARREGLTRLFWRLQELQEQYDEVREEIPDWVTEHESEFKNHVGNIQRHEGEESPPDADFFR